MSRPLKFRLEFKLDALNLLQEEKSVSDIFKSGLLWHTCIGLHESSASY